MANVFDVASYICNNVGGEISAMKLQKLCYYSQAWQLVWTNGQSLFAEEFYKWDGGPVCRDLFDIHKGLFWVDASIIRRTLLSDESNQLTTQEMGSIDQVLEDYGKYDGGQLSELTHREDPWRNAKKNGIITKESMRAYYASLLLDHVRQNQETAACEC